MGAPMDDSGAIEQLQRVAKALGYERAWANPYDTSKWFCERGTDKPGMVDVAKMDDLIKQHEGSQEGWPYIADVVFAARAFVVGRCKEVRLRSAVEQLHEWERADANHSPTERYEKERAFTEAADELACRMAHPLWCGTFDQTFVDAWRAINPDNRALTEPAKP